MPDSIRDMRTLFRLNQSEQYMAAKATIPMLRAKLRFPFFEVVQKASTFDLRVCAAIANSIDRRKDFTSVKTEAENPMLKRCREHIQYFDLYDLAERKFSREQMKDIEATDALLASFQSLDSIKEWITGVIERFQKNPRAKKTVKFFQTMKTSLDGDGTEAFRLLMETRGHKFALLLDLWGKEPSDDLRDLTQDVGLYDGIAQKLTLHFNGLEYRLLDLFLLK